MFSTVERKKKIIIFFNTISRGVGFLVFKQKSSLIGNLITYPFTQNLQLSVLGTVVVKYASSKRQQYNLVINVVFHCNFLKKT